MLYYVTSVCVFWKSFIIFKQLVLEAYWTVFDNFRCKIAARTIRFWMLLFSSIFLKVTADLLPLAVRSDPKFGKLLYETYFWKNIQHILKQNFFVFKYFPKNLILWKVEIMCFKKHLGVEAFWASQVGENFTANIFYLFFSGNPCIFYTHLRSGNDVFAVPLYRRESEEAVLL